MLETAVPRLLEGGSVPARSWLCLEFCESWRGGFGLRPPGLACPRAMARASSLCSEAVASGSCHGVCGLAFSQRWATMVKKDFFTFCHFHVLKIDTILFWNKELYTT